MRKTVIPILVVLMLPLLILTRPQPALAHFTISSWDFPDEYGQGIEGFEIHENSTGSWQQVNGYFPYEDPCILTWNVSVGIKLFCYTWFNSTLTGATSGADGKNYQRHNVTVMDLAENIVFSQQNFTYYSVDTGIDPPMWFYEYYVILDFLPLAGEYYTVTVTYEVYW